MKRTILVLLGATAIYQIQAQPQRQRAGGLQQQQRNRPAFSFQSFDHSTGFPGVSSSFSSPDISSQLAAQLTSSSAGSSAAADFQEQPQRGNEVLDTVANLPLYKQSFPGVYVKGHAVENLNKFEPTRQVDHHHGPNYQIPQNVAPSSSSHRNIEGNLFSVFN